MTSATLADELVLLAYDDETGRTAVPRIALDLGLGAAVLVELVLRGRVTVGGTVDGTLDSAVRVVDPTATGEPVLDEVLVRIAADLPRAAASWLQRLRHRLRDLVLSSLVRRGIMRDLDVTELEYIHLHRYPRVDRDRETDARARLAEALADRRTPDERTAALATLVAAVRMEPTLGLSGPDASTAHRRLEEIASDAVFADWARATGPAPAGSIPIVISELHRAVAAALGPPGAQPVAS